MTPFDVIEGRAKWCVVEGDCREVLPTLPVVDAMVTDPPYGYAYASNWPGKFKGEVIACDESEAARDAVLAWARCAWAMFGAEGKSTRPDGTRGVLVWDKGLGAGMGDLSFPWKPNYELIFVGGRGWSGARDSSVLSGHAVVTWSGAEGQRLHPNEKPVGLLEDIIRKAPGDIVLDPFCGSGTTGVACLRLGRRFIGIEREPKYAAIARERLAAESQGLTLRDARAGQLSLLGGTP
ncbi:MAG: site-specific DNA-methyltransferase [Rhodocyclaceae bacterium]|nr:site-specific DNA-methyltransferase [Rhodocyclaceae bacterium]